MRKEEDYKPMPFPWWAYCLSAAMEGLTFALTVAYQKLWLLLLTAVFILIRSWMDREFLDAGVSRHDCFMRRSPCNAAPLLVVMLFRFHWVLLACVAIATLGLWLEWRWHIFSRRYDREKEA